MGTFRWLLTSEGATGLDKLVLFISKCAYILSRRIDIAFYGRTNRPNYITYFPCSVTVRTRYGFKAKVDDWFKMVMFTGDYESFVHERINLDEYSNFVDVGSNLGFYTLFAASKSSKGKIISIEADKKLFNRLVENVKVNEFTNVECICCAIWDTDNSEVKLYEDEKGSYNPSCFGGGSNYSLVSTRTLDSITLEHKLSRIDWLKIDVESAEVNALLGAKNTLEITHNVLLEVHSVENGENCKQILTSSGFTLEVIKQFKEGYYWIHAKKGSYDDKSTRIV